MAKTFRSKSAQGMRWVRAGCSADFTRHGFSVVLARASVTETSGQGSTIDVSAQLALDEGGQAAAVGTALTISGKEGLEWLSYDPVEEGLSGSLRR